MGGAPKPSACALALAAALVVAPARAHEVGLSRGDYVVEGARVTALVVFARKELIGLVAGLDADHDGALTPAELSAARDSIEGALVSRIRVQGDGVPCPGTLESTALTEQDGVAVHAVYRCARRPRKLGVELAFLSDLSTGHRHLARATAGASLIDSVLSQRNPSLSLDVPAETGRPEPSEPAAPAGAPPLQRGALLVLTRPFGPAFLLALLVTCPGRRDALVAAASFFAAAAVGLVLGARGLFLPSPPALAAAVALSLVYAGLEAMASRRGRARWAMAAPFGLVHGLACATAFQAEGAASSLTAFGAGVGLSLAAAIGVLVAATRWALGKPGFATKGAMAVGAVIAAAGAIGLILGRA
jgi:hypothetical protein